MVSAHPEEHFTYSTVAIVGVGLIGGSLGLSLRRAGFTGRILGVSRAESLRDARRLGAIDEGASYDDLVEVAAASDLVVLASPILRILEQLETLGDAGKRLQNGCVITDVGSTKARILEVASQVLPAHVRFIGGHPLTGSEARGVNAADSLLFENSYYVLTPADGVPDTDTRRLASFLETVGARILILPATEHDRVAAAISHLPQLLAVSLVNSLDGLGPLREHGIRMDAGGFRDMTRIASSPFSVWQDIFATNREEVLGSLQGMVREIQDGLGRLEPQELDRAFARASKTRSEIPTDTKGFLRELWELFVVLEDHPGQLARLTTLLAEQEINIKDIELLKVREGAASSFRLAFDTEGTALEALKVLEAGGFQARLRK